MKRLLLCSAALLLLCSTAFAEATFDQIQGLIKAHDYAPAVQGLQLIIQNHPRSAKAYYAMSQAQAGLGNQIKAKEALDMATGIDPALKFASSSNVENLKEAIQPQTRKIQAIESHALRNGIIMLLLLCGVWYAVYRWKEGEKRRLQAQRKPGPKPAEPDTDRQAAPPLRPGPKPAEPDTDKQAAPPPRPGPTPTYNMREPLPPTPTMYQSGPAPTVHHTTVVNNNSGGSDLLTGVMLGEMLAAGHEHRTVEREVIREVPAPAPEPRRSSWDTPTQEKKSSSWDSGSSDSSSSWDSGSSDSSSSWD